MSLMTDEQIISQYDKGVRIKTIVAEYLSADKANGKVNGYKPSTTINYATKHVYEVIRKYWNEVYVNELNAKV